MKNIVLAIIMLMPAVALSHGGGLDRNGCHHDRKNGGYHCHKSAEAPAERTVSSDLNEETCPIVGNTNSKIYHIKGGSHYLQMLEKNKSDENRKCFTNEDQAKVAGYRKSKI